MGRPLEQGRRRELEDAIPIVDRAQIPIVAHIAKARIPLRIRLANLRRAIGGGVVADDDLEVAKGLRQETSRGLAPETSRRCRPAGRSRAREWPWLIFKLKLVDK